MKLRIDKCHRGIYGETYTNAFLRRNRPEIIYVASAVEIFYNFYQFPV